jgi:hypothetical protein
MVWKLVFGNWILGNWFLEARFLEPRLILKYMSVSA